MSEEDYSKFCPPFFRVGQPFGVLEWIVFEAKKGLADAFLTRPLGRRDECRR
jgi:hypothetical protein